MERVSARVLKPAAGIYFKRVWLKAPTSLDGHVVAGARAWDLGSTVDGDWTVGVLIGRTATGGYVIEHVKRVRGRPAKRDALILKTAQDDSRAVKVVLADSENQGAKGSVTAVDGQVVIRDLKTKQLVLGSGSLNGNDHRHH